MHQSRSGTSWHVVAAAGRSTIVLLLVLSGCPSSEPAPLFDLGDASDGADATDDECTSDEACQPETSDPCRTWTCDAGACAGSDQPDGAACNSDRARLGQACLAGVCSGGTARYSCEVIAFEECCTPDGDLFFCDDDHLTWHGCGGGGCGWDADGELYDCDRASEASGDRDIPYLCPDETCDDACAGLSCGSVCGVSCGARADGTERCDAGQCVPCGCDGLSCGDDGCGNSCGTCEGTAACQGGTCVSACGDLTQAGCCAGAVLTYCNQLGQVSEITCSPDSCGWDPSPQGSPEGEGWYDCGFTGEDPSGATPAACPADVGGGG